MTKARDFRDQTIEELQATQDDLRKELFHLKNELRKAKKVEKPHLLRLKRKDIARLLTVIHQKQTAQQNSAT